MMGIRIKNYELRIKVILSFFILALFFILYSLFYHPTYAQVQSCGSVTTQPRAEGLVSTQTVTGKFYTSSRGCIVDERASFVSFRVPDYETLKSLYFTQAKESSALKKITITGNATQGSLSLTTNTAAHISGNMSLSGNISGNSIGIIFIDGKLDISQNFTTGGPGYGVVLAVKGNVVIAPAVTRVDAVIISNGTIYTAGEFCSTSSTSTPQLTINGSLISLNPDSRIRFCRNLADNIQPAEIINYQPKYVVILRNIFSEKFRKFSEITADAPPPAPTTAPTPTPIPTPTPTSTPAPTATPTSSPTPSPTPSCTNGYKDTDKDGYGTGAFGCYATSTSYNIVSNNTDCYDSNANAKPGQTSYFTTNRGDNSWDYDCSGAITANSSEWGTFCSVSENWYNSSDCTNPMTNSTDARRCLGGPYSTSATGSGCGQVAAEIKYYLACDEDGSCSCSSAARAASESNKVGCK